MESTTIALILAAAKGSTPAICQELLSEAPLFGAYSERTSVRSSTGLSAVPANPNFLTLKWNSFIRQALCVSQGHGALREALLVLSRQAQDAQPKMGSTHQDRRHIVSPGILKRYRLLLY